MSTKKPNLKTDAVGGEGGKVTISQDERLRHIGREWGAGAIIATLAQKEVLDLARKLAEEVLAKAAKCEYCRTNDPTAFSTVTGFLICEECRLVDLIVRPYVTPPVVLLARELLAVLGDER